ncbi:hypothetical protein [Chryseobacterium sp. Hurlbut01]|uniref:hypothetical protein n=1 Tax=Chryseobacterium sp. Hurlbut01 TaxID=1681828 RepID=UPI00067E0AA9|nr:hypothetical protein [Chryseobacterium sp. Hurlbut01]KNB63052.1 hypothetical protein AC804_00085 [Chryseobacterium sp. Hurlbut01]
MAGEGGNIIRNVFGKSYKEAESITKDASKGALDFKSPEETTFNGKNGGKKFDDYKKKDNQTLLRVKKIKGPIDPSTNKAVDAIERGKPYNYEVIEFSRTPTKSELKNLKWGIKYDNGEMAEAIVVRGLKEISYNVPRERNISKLKIYAFFNGKSEEVCVEVKLCQCSCKMPEENYPYSDNTFSKIKEIAPLIKHYANLYCIPAAAIAGSIADEYNIINESTKATIINWLQDDVVLNFMPNFAIEFDVYVGGKSKLNNATKHDLGIGNIKLETAKQLYNEYKVEFKSKNWDYKDIVNYIQSNEGTVHLAALVIKKAQRLLTTEIKSYCQCKQEAVLVTYYKQGDSYIVRFQNKKKKTPLTKIEPGEGCRVSLQRKKILSSLGIN